ncbi:MAG: DNA-processing protein DprA [Spirochaetales bacterium]|nr:DNA-processing protein DprA [Spirochaetales bacterium]
MNEHLHEAINFTTLVRVLRQSETTVEPLFEQLALQVDVNKPLIEHLDQYTKAISIPRDMLLSQYRTVIDAFKTLSTSDVILKRGDSPYPEQAFSDPYAPRFLYGRGNIDLLKLPVVAVIGTHNPSREGRRNAHQAAQLLTKAGYIISSSLALGIDGIAHLTCLAMKKPTIAVIGTSLVSSYPAEHAELQRQIGEDGLVLSRFSPASETQKWFFPLRNRLMSSLSIASVVVEDRDGGKAVRQAEYALDQGRLVIIFKHTFENRALSWPRRLSIRPGTLVVKDPSQIVSAIERSRSGHAPQYVDPSQLTLF